MLLCGRHYTSQSKPSNSWKPAAAGAMWCFGSRAQERQPADAMALAPPRLRHRTGSTTAPTPTSGGNRLRMWLVSWHVNKTDAADDDPTLMARGVGRRTPESAGLPLMEVDLPLLSSIVRGADGDPPGGALTSRHPDCPWCRYRLPARRSLVGFSDATCGSEGGDALVERALARCGRRRGVGRIDDLQCEDPRCASAMAMGAGDDAARCSRVSVRSLPSRRSSSWSACARESTAFRGASNFGRSTLLVLLREQRYHALRACVGVRG